MKKKSNSFYVSFKNKKGVFIFLLIALIVVFIPRILLTIKPEEKFEISAEDIRVLKTERAAYEKRSSFSNYKKKKMRYVRPKSKFDPNAYTLNDWMSLGLSQKQAVVVLKFTDRGIYSNDQLQKIFVIPAELFEMIKDSTYYPSKEFEKKEYQKTDYAKKEIILTDINGASQEDLEAIPGVGPFYAKNILKYRERLGGFNKKEQLLEVWKMEVEKYNSIEKYIKINTNQIQKMNLNEISSEELKKHPYLNWSIANSIVKMRDQKGGFKRIDEIKESVLIDEELFEKIKPYLSL